MNPFGENLRRIRIEMNMSQDEFATLLGTSKQVVSRYENGQRSPKVSIVADYAQKLGVSIAQLTGEASMLHSKLDPALGSDTPLSNKLRALGAALTPSESELLSIFRRLNDTGQLALIATARGLDGNPDMKKDGESSDTTTA